MAEQIDFRVKNGLVVATTATILGNIQATSTTSGALIVKGGVGIGSNLYVGGEIVAQRLTIQLTTITTTLVQTDDIIQTYNTTNATGTSTGALVVAGGAGVGRDLYVGGTIYQNGVAVGSGGVGSSTTSTNVIVTNDTSSVTVNYISFVSTSTTVGTGLKIDASDLVFVPSTGRVGIGTSNPQRPLHVFTLGTSTQGIAAFEAPASGFVIQDNSGQSGVVELIGLKQTSSTYHSILLRADVTGLLVQKTTGNVGIGTLTPPNKLSVNSTASTLSSQVQISHPAGDWGFTIKRTADDAGNPNFALLKSRGEVPTQIVQGDALGRVAWHAVTNTTGSVITQVAEIGAVNANFVANDADADIFFSTKSTGTSVTEKVRITAIGRVLIGLTANQDGSALQIDANNVSSTVYSGRISNSNTSTSVYNVVRWIQGEASSAIGYAGTGGSTTGNTAFQNTFVVGTQNATALVLATNDTERVRVLSGGDFGIGTSPSTKFHVLGSNTVARIQSSTSYVDLQLSNSTSANGFLQYSGVNLNFFANSGSTPTMTITGGSPGNVGVGSTPTYKFDVTGQTRIGVNVTQSAPSTTDILSTAHVMLGGNGGNYLTIGQYSSGQSFAQWIQSSYVNPTTAIYNLVLQPLGGNVGIGTALPQRTLQINAASPGIRLEETGAGNKRLELLVDSTGVATVSAPQSAQILTFATVGSERIRIFSNGNVAINTTTDSSFRLEVNGSFAATTKSFVIDHPTKPGMRLRYGSLEGPENGVYVRGKLKGTNVIELPEYWTKLVEPEFITVNLTPIGRHQDLYVEEIIDNKVLIKNGNLLNKEIHCFYIVFAERKDVEKLQVEVY